MDKEKTKHLTRDDWLKAALNLCVAGIDNVKVAPLATELGVIAPLATELGVTTGSFYWHFKNRQELLEALLKYWEYEMTDKAIEAAKRYEGSPTDRILFVMEKVMNNGLAHFDLPIWQWAQTDTIANRAFKRALKKRFSYATRMFSEAGFSREQAEIIYMMGESTLIPESMAKRKEFIKLKHTILTAPE